MRRIKRALTTIAFICLAPSWLWGSVGQAAESARVAPSESDEALRIWNTLGKVTTLQARFVQTRTSHILARPIESRGNLTFARPDKMAWTVEHPARSTLVLKGTQVGMAYPDLGVREELDLEGNAEVASLIQATMVWLGGDLDRLRRDYTVEWKGGVPATVLLRPKLSALSSIIATLELSIEVDPTLIREVLITEPDGDTVEIRFDEVRLGEALAADAFSLP